VIEPPASGGTRRWTTMASSPSVYGSRGKPRATAATATWFGTIGGGHEATGTAATQDDSVSGGFGSQGRLDPAGTVAGDILAGNILAGNIIAGGHGIEDAKSVPIYVGAQQGFGSQQSTAADTAVPGAAGLSPAAAAAVHWIAAARVRIWVSGTTAIQLHKPVAELIPERGGTASGQVPRHDAASAAAGGRGSLYLGGQLLASVAG
jgi:hypothetical protein